MTDHPNQQGFTMIEFIVVIVVLGILVLGGIFGLKQAMDGYSLAQASATSTQKAQNALDRIVSELSHITYNSGSARYSITAGTASSITYTANFGGTDESGTVITLSGNQVLLKNYLLTDSVATNGLQLLLWTETARLWQLPVQPCILSRLL